LRIIRNIDGLDRRYEPRSEWTKVKYIPGKERPRMKRQRGCPHRPPSSRAFLPLPLLLRHGSTVRDGQVSHPERWGCEACAKSETQGTRTRQQKVIQKSFQWTIIVYTYSGTKDRQRADLDMFKTSSPGARANLQSRAGHSTWLARALPTKPLSDV